MAVCLTWNKDGKYFFPLQKNLEGVTRRYTYKKGITPNP